MSQQILKILISILLILFSCQNQQISTRKPAVVKSAKELAVQAELQFAISPRKSQAVFGAYALMKTAARKSAKNNPDRYKYFVRAARFGIWLSYHVGTNSITLATSSASACSLESRYSSSCILSITYSPMLVYLATCLLKESMALSRSDLRMQVIATNH